MSEDRIVDLLNGLVSDAEARAMLDHLKSCSPCEARFVRLARHHETMRARPAPTLSSDGQVVAPSPAATRPVVRRRRRVRLAAAASIVAAAVAVWAVVAPRGPEAPQEELPGYWLPSSDDERSVRARNEVDELRVLADAIDAYGRRDLRAAIDGLRSVKFAKPHDEFENLRALYLVSALVNDAQYDSAIAAMPPLPKYRRVGGHLPQPWRQRYRWICYLAYRGAENNQSAGELLDILVEDDGEIGRLARAERERRNTGN